MGQILNGGNVNGTGGADNNSNGKNTHVKAGFSIYNIASPNAGASGIIQVI